MWDPEEEEELENLLGIEIIHRCEHRCPCGCHHLDGTQHPTHCCEPCGMGHEQIRAGTMKRHLEECHDESLSE